MEQKKRNQYVHTSKNNVINYRDDKYIGNLVPISIFLFISLKKCLQIIN